MRDKAGKVYNPRQAQIKTPPKKRGRRVFRSFLVPALTGYVGYFPFFLLLEDFFADFLEPPDFLVAFFIERFSLT
jgi:hypothetical protein